MDSEQMDGLLATLDEGVKHLAKISNLLEQLVGKLASPAVKATPSSPQPQLVTERDILAKAKDAAKLVMSFDGSRTRLYFTCKRLREWIGLAPKHGTLVRHALNSLEAERVIRSETNGDRPHVFCFVPWHDDPKDNESALVDAFAEVLRKATPPGHWTTK